MFKSTLPCTALQKLCIMDVSLAPSNMKTSHSAPILMQNHSKGDSVVSSSPTYTVAQSLHMHTTILKPRESNPSACPPPPPPPITPKMWMKINSQMGQQVQRCQWVRVVQGVPEIANVPNASACATTHTGHTCTCASRYSTYKCSCVSLDTTLST